MHRTAEHSILNVLRLCALLVASFVSPSQAQESLVKGETLVRLQTIPLSKPMNFEQKYVDDQIDYLARIGVKALDTSSAWNITSPGWNIYFVNLRADLEATLRQRTNSANASLRTLSQNAETSLAQTYASTLSEAELDQAVQFYQSATGKKFLAYQRALRQAYYRGQSVYENMRATPGVGLGKTDAELRSAWLASNKMPADAPTGAYAFHVNILQPLFPSVPASDLAFNLAAGAMPGGEAMRRLDMLLSAEERAEVTQYLASPSSAKEIAAVKAWQAKMNNRPEVVPMFASSLLGIIGVIERWRNHRGNPDALPRSVAKIDPATLQMPESLQTHRLDSDAVEQLKACLPGSSATTLSSVERFVQNREFTRASTTYFNPDARAFYATRGERAACIKTTAAGYPILPPESFAGTVSVVGVSEEQLLEWRKKLARSIAATGSAASLLIFPNGNAFEINFAVQAPNSPQTLVYSMRFRPNGTFAESDYGIVEKMPGMRSLSNTATAGADGIERKTRSVLVTADEIRRDNETRTRTN
ncbi:DUF2059 domain-containing protein [Variovorax sp. PCZ-1]|uniref:DUF2059 domain-containing protein n=1 Tax=Variovorax sp. PCZ-1 TaxID=2835533 RepID=UPI001BCEB84A|nr:DUF2059 domain-containing protein [Variovorax sp. PCZ-1]MBS7807242.1 DUF2059 domain-containing protein [Variovorax sp. PCZ-1]